MDGQPTVTGTFVYIDLHIQQLIEYVIGLAEDGIMQGSPPLLSELVDDKRLDFLYLDELFLLDILGVILEDIKKGLFVLLLDLLQHLLALRIEVLPDIELLLVPLLFLLVLLLLDCPHLLRFGTVEAEDIVEVSLIDVHVFVLFLGLLFLEQLDIDLHAFLDAVVGDRPTPYHSVVHLPLLHSHDEVAGTLAHSLLEVLQQLLGRFAEVYIDALCLGLKDAVFVD